MHQEALQLPPPPAPSPGVATVLVASPGNLQPPGLAPGCGGRAARCLARALPAFARELLQTSGLWAMSRVSLNPDTYFADPKPKLLSQLSWLDFGSPSSLEAWLFLNCSAFLVWLLQDPVLEGESTASGRLATAPSSQALFPWWNSPLAQSKPFAGILLFLGSWDRQLGGFWTL